MELRYARRAIAFLGFVTTGGLLLTGSLIVLFIGGFVMRIPDHVLLGISGAIIAAIPLTIAAILWFRAPTWS